MFVGSVKYIIIKNVGFTGTQLPTYDADKTYFYLFEFLSYLYSIKKNSFKFVLTYPFYS